MSRVIISSTKFPVKHPKAGQPTFFVEKIWLWLIKQSGYSAPIFHPEFKGIVSMLDILDHTIWKGHTIRVGRLWKAGDIFSPRIWSGKPYRSKMITFAHDIKLASVLDIEITIAGNSMIVGYRPKENPEQLILIPLTQLAKNDGLDCQDFIDWFKCHPKKKGTGPLLAQILIWDKNLKYD